MWWHDDTDQDEMDIRYQHILELEARIARLVAHQVRVRRLLMQECSMDVEERIIQVQKEVDYYLRLMRQERQEEVDQYERLRIERSLGQTRHVTGHPVQARTEWGGIEEKLALEVEQLRRVLEIEQKRRNEEGW